MTLSDTQWRKPTRKKGGEDYRAFFEQKGEINNGVGHSSIWIYASDDKFGDFMKDLLPVCLII